MRHSGWLLAKLHDRDGEVEKEVLTEEGLHEGIHQCDRLKEELRERLISIQTQTQEEHSTC